MGKKFGIPAVQLAAGGVVWRTLAGETGLKLAVLHRPKYDDWSLPKGKPERDENLGDTAWREVKEEVGCETEFLEFAGITSYPTGGGHFKVVLFWHMRADGEGSFVPNAEVDQVLWLTPDEADRKLSYQVEKDLLRKALATAPKA